MTPLSSNYLEQNNFVFSGSVYDNLTLGKDVKHDWLTKQLDKAGLSSRLTLDTILQGNGQNLSGGKSVGSVFLEPIFKHLNCYGLGKLLVQLGEGTYFSDFLISS